MIIIPGDRNTFIIYMIVLGVLMMVLLLITAIVRMVQKKKIKQFVEACPDAAKIYFNHVGATHTFVHLIDGIKPTKFDGKPNGAFVAPGKHTIACKWSVQINKSQFNTTDGYLDCFIEPNKQYKIIYNKESNQFFLEEYTANS